MDEPAPGRQPESTTPKPLRAAFLSSGWRTAAEAASRPVCWDLSPALFAHADSLLAAGRIDEATSVLAVARACHLALRPDDPDGPLVPQFVGENRRTPALRDFDNDDLEFFASLLGDLDILALVARIGDIVWLRRRDWTAAKTAADAYLRAAISLINAGHLVDTDPMVRRALDIASEIGRTQPTFASVSAELQSLVRELAAHGENKYTIGLFRALLHHRQGDPAEFGDLLERWAERATSAEDWTWAQHWWGLAKKYAVLAGDHAAVERRTRGSARAFEAQAEHVAAKQHGHSAVAAHWLQAAVAALQRVRGTGEERRRLTARALLLQEESLDGMGIHRHSVDLTDVITAAETRVTQTSLSAAIAALATLAGPVSVSTLEDQTRQMAKEAPFSHLLAHVNMDRRGRVRARRPAMPLLSDQTSAAAFRARLVEVASFHQQVLAVAVDRARLVIQEQHPLEIGEFLLLAQASPFVPPGRERSFAQGLFLGARGDFLTCTHVLLPQLENALRWHLRCARVPTVTQRRDGVQSERTLDELLKMPELEPFLGPDNIFDLQALLVEECGTNLRNEVAHGLLDDDQFDGWAPRYFWWAMLRLCVLPMLPQSSTEFGGTTAGEEEPPPPLSPPSA